jgi:hypothetical protein
VAQLRVMLGPMPAMLRDIIRETVASQDDLVLVGSGDTRDAPHLHRAVDVHAPDVLVAGVEGSDWVGEYVELFRDHPDLRVLVVRNDARAAALHELVIRRFEVADPSPRSILAAIRATRLRTASDVTPSSGRR